MYYRIITAGKPSNKWYKTEYSKEKIISMIEMPDRQTVEFKER